MLRELLTVFRGANKPMAAMREDFTEMLRLALENFLAAGALYFGEQETPQDRSALYRTDIQINKLERRVRQRVASHLTVSASRHDVPYCLLLVTLVKDVERIGDYSKNLSEIVEVYSAPLPDDEIFGELREIRREVEKTFSAVGEVLATSDRERALQHIQAGRAVAQRCDMLLTAIAKSDYDAALTTAAVLGTRYYKRFGGHMLNILSSVVMPLHKVDYYDEDVLKDPAFQD